MQYFIVILSFEYPVSFLSEGLNCFSILPQKQLIPIMTRLKENRIRNESISSLKAKNKREKSISNRSNIKFKNKLTIEPQYDEIIIPNWTYSTELGVVYNPIQEKRVKVIKRSARKKTKDFDPSVNPIVELNQSTPVIILSRHSNYSVSLYTDRNKAVGSNFFKI